jgi:hypothetical protein
VDPDPGGPKTCESGFGSEYSMGPDIGAVITERKKFASHFWNPIIFTFDLFFF